MTSIGYFQPLRMLYERIWHNAIMTAVRFRRSHNAELGHTLERDKANWQPEFP